MRYTDTLNSQGRFRWLRNTALLLVWTLSFSACEKILDKDAQHNIKEENKWRDINDACASLMGIYGLVRTALAEGNGHWIYGDLRAGDFVAPNRRELQDVIEGKLNSSNGLTTRMSNWRKFYAAINAANVFIERSGQITKLDPQYTALNHQIDVAQARALKGYCYFLLTRIWGDVPIWDKAYEGVFPELEVSSADVVLAYAEQELKAAARVVPYRYGILTDEVYPILNYHGYTFERWDEVLLNRSSINALLAHVYAWGGKYLEASTYSEMVLNNAAKSNSQFAMSTDLTASDGFFYKSTNSQLIAFPFKWSALEATFEGHIEALTLAAPLVSKPVPDIYLGLERIRQLFYEAGDVRFHIDKNGSYISSYFSSLDGLRPIFSKIKVIRGGTVDGSFPLFSSVLVFSRMEDIALLRAEALAVLGDENGIARGILNQVRASRGLGDVTFSRDLIDEIFAERRRELMGEGWRWFDQVRYHRIKRNDPAFMQLIANKGIYWPIAQEVLGSNRSLKQNPYWENK